MWHMWIKMLQLQKKKEEKKKKKRQGATVLTIMENNVKFIVI